MTPYIIFPATEIAWTECAGSEADGSPGGGRHVSHFLRQHLKKIHLCENGCKISGRRAWAEFKDFENDCPTEAEVYLRFWQGSSGVLCNLVCGLIQQYEASVDGKDVTAPERRPISATACHLSFVKTSALASLPHQRKQMSSEPLGSQTLK